MVTLRKTFDNEFIKQATKPLKKAVIIWNVS